MRELGGEEIAAEEKDRDMRHYLGLILVGAMVAFGAGCSEDGGSGGSGGSGGTGGTGGGISDVACSPESYTETDCEDLAPTGAIVDCSAGGGTDLCADNGGSGEVSITAEEITADTCLSADCDYVLEAASENLEVKKKILANLEKVVRPDCLIGFATSAI